MRYWDDMGTKFGFSDGGAIPPDALACRYVCVALMNRLLKKHGSAVRVVPWDREGFHNSVLIQRVPAELFTEEELAAWNAHLWGGTPALGEQPLTADQAQRFCDRLPHCESEVDDAWAAAWDEAIDLSPENFVEVDVRIDQDAFAECLNRQ